MSDENIFYVIKMKKNIMEKFGGRTRIDHFLRNVDPETIMLNVRKDGRIVTFDENDPITVETDDGYEFVLEGQVDGKNIRTRVYPVTHRANSAWCKLNDSGLLGQFNSTSDGVPIDIDDPVCKRLGNRNEVYSGLARKTSGGLTRSDLIKVGDRIISRKEYDVALKRTKVAKKINERGVRREFKEQKEGKSRPVGFMDVAEGLSLDEIYTLINDPFVEPDVKDTLAEFAKDRLRSLVSQVLGYNELNIDGTPFGISALQMRDYRLLTQRFEDDILVYSRQMDTLDAIERALMDIRP